MPLRCDEKEINFVGRFEGIGGSGNIFGSGSIVGNIWQGWLILWGIEATYFYIYF